MAEVFNTTAYGNGLEGFINWTNHLTGDWMISLFILVIGLAGYIVGKNQNLDKFTAMIMSGGVMVLLVAIFQLFTVVNPQVLFIGLVFIGIGVGGKILGK